VNMPLCSVVVPSYRHEAYLREALESVYRQSYPRIELIVIDDGSPDRSFEIACEMTQSMAYRQRFERIVCERNPANTGAHFSLNRGADLARGDYVFFLNSDDRYHPARLSAMISEMRSTGRGFAFSAVNPISAPGRFIHEWLLDVILKADMGIARLPSLSFALLRRNHAFSTGNFAIRRELLRAIGPFIDLKITHDWDFALRAMTFEEPLYIPEPLYDYRLHGSNTQFGTEAHRGNVESEVALMRYFALVKSGQVRNRLAPTPANWPGVFEHYLRVWGMEDLWKKVAFGYVPSDRTLEGPIQPG
jgi:glycosyltransferase involved in cell wall biosynthesis